MKLLNSLHICKMIQGKHAKPNMDDNITLIKYNHNALNKLVLFHSLKVVQDRRIVLRSKQVNRWILIVDWCIKATCQLHSIDTVGMYEVLILAMC